MERDLCTKQLTTRRPYFQRNFHANRQANAVRLNKKQLPNQVQLGDYNCVPTIEKCRGIDIEMKK